MILTKYIIINYIFIRYLFNVYYYINVVKLKVLWLSDILEMINL